MDAPDPAGVGVLAAFAAGLVSFLSPCVLPLVPGYLSAVTGASYEELERGDWRRVVIPSLAFIGAFSLGLHPPRPDRHRHRQLRCATTSTR